MTDKSQFAEAFDRDTDPLAEFAPKFDQLDADPYEAFITDVVETNGVKSSTVDRYRQVWNEWAEFMADRGRHPACPSEEHVTAFCRWQRDDKGNATTTVREKIRRLNKGYEYWQRDASFPHPVDFNPFESGVEKVDLSADDPKEFHPLTVADLRNVLADVNRVRDRTVIVMQLKTGLRASELGNIKLSEITIENSELRRHYDELGSHPKLDGKENAVFIPHDRDGNKSRVDRILPLDDETRKMLLEWLLIRPDNGEPWLFLSDTHHEKVEREAINDVWTKAFQPEYSDTDEYRGITSHFGRHFVTTWFRSEKGINEELIKYLRGDKREEETMDRYTHTKFRHLEPIYRKEIFRLNLVS